MNQVEVLSSDLLHKLSEVGFLASESGLSDDALAICSGLAKLKPELSHLQVKLALIQARSGDIDTAISSLRNVVKKFPQDFMAKAMLGTFLVDVGQNSIEAVDLLEQVIAQDEDLSAIDVARACYELACKQKKETAPVSPPTAGLQFFRHYNV